MFKYEFETGPERTASLVFSPMRIGAVFIKSGLKHLIKPYTAIILTVGTASRRERAPRRTCQNKKKSKDRKFPSKPLMACRVLCDMFSVKNDSLRICKLYMNKFRSLLAIGYLMRSTFCPISPTNALAFRRDSAEFVRRPMSPNLPQ
ncbi:hypothetical protein EVAR_62606_1 [Eumeta japonica]|uniref:Uncharacterized protein n=1 Tax=Eumeta variegata TaxID=151549 RepID=A0A4C1ZFC1_EUMVA|nr:hypothetical protein EVAR_62606_1 [Eumeta japonica]